MIYIMCYTLCDKYGFSMLIHDLICYTLCDKYGFSMLILPNSNCDSWLNMFLSENTNYIINRLYLAVRKKKLFFLIGINFIIFFMQKEIENAWTIVMIIIKYYAMSMDIIYLHCDSNKYIVLSE